MKLNWRILCVQIAACLSIAAGYIVDPGPVVVATKGEIWPKPKMQTTTERFSIIRPATLKFQASNQTCDILEKAVERYKKIITTSQNPLRRKMRYRVFSAPVNQSTKHMSSWRNDVNFDGYLEMVILDLKVPCEKLPSYGMDEAYELSLETTTAKIESYSIWGILRGLESFSQMVVLSDDGGVLRINATKIVDEPRFSHRGLLVDTSRHYISVCTLIQTLDGMAYNKMNVFHWHIVDDHSFPYQSTAFPELSEKGAFHPEAMIYTQDDVQRVIEEARLRGIRVLVEFDTPGHTRSWGVSHPEILTTCHDQYEGKLGPLDPTKEATYDFLFKLYSEIVDVFPDKYVHLGGDEVGFECWASNKDILKYMQDHKLNSFEMLEEMFIQRLVDQVDKLNESSIVWQEVYVNGVRLPAETVVHVWTGDRKDLLNKITKDGLPALLSSCWYLDHLSTGGDWRKFYNCDPHDFPGDEKQKQLVLGGEACMWAEVVNDHNILQRIFPRVSAAAERLWSQESVNDADAASCRLEEQACRMNFRGIPAQPPNGPGYCL